MASFRREDVIPFLKFGSIGVLNTVLHSAVVIVSHGSFGVPVVLSHIGAFLLVNAFSYVMNSRLVFHRELTWAGYLRFVAVSLFSLGVTISIATLCDIAELDYRIGLVGVIILAPPVTYLLQKVFTFKKA